MVDKPKYTWEFYQDKKGEWRWRKWASNGQKVGASSEGFKSKASCQANARIMGWHG